jgi:hypothetical protein
MIIEYVWKKGIFTDPLLQLRTWRRVVRSGERRRRLSHWSTRSLHWRRREARIGGDVGSYVKYANAAVYDDWREEKKKNSSRLLQAFRRPSHDMHHTELTTLDSGYAPDRQNQRPLTCTKYVEQRPVKCTILNSDPWRTTNRTRDPLWHLVLYFSVEYHNSRENGLAKSFLGSLNRIVCRVYSLRKYFYIVYI